MSVALRAAKFWGSYCVLGVAAFWGRPTSITFAIGCRNRAYIRDASVACTRGIQLSWPRYDFRIVLVIRLHSAK